MTDFLKLKLMGLITLINVVVGLVMGILLFFTNLENYFDWYPAIPVFYLLTSLAMVFSLDSVKRKKGDVTVTTFMVIRFIRFTLTVVFLLLYLRFVGEHPRAFGFTLMLFYFIYLAMEICTVYLYEKKWRKEKMKRNPINRIIAVATFLLAGCFTAHATQEVEEQTVDVEEIVFSHIQDAYTWHITEWNDKVIAIPLPIIVKGEAGWDCFLSSQLHEGKTYNGFYIAAAGSHVGKVVTKNAAGEEVRPLDFSLTKNVCGLFLSCAVLLTIFLSAAKWYQKHPYQVPKGFIGMIEAVVVYILDDVIKDSIGKDYKPFASYLLTVFFFILVNNLIGLVPVFPGGANITGNISITFILAVGTFIVTNLFATKQYWKDVFWPNVPIYLKLPLPMMQFVEFFGVFTKPFALMIRLFANIMVGHTIILALSCLIFITTNLGVVINTGMTVVSVLFCIFMNCLELLVACLQAYIFTLLSANYIGLAKVKNE